MSEIPNANNKFSEIKELVMKNTSNFVISAENFTSNGIRTILTQFFGKHKVTFKDFSIQEDNPDKLVITAKLKNSVLGYGDLKTELEFTCPKNSIELKIIFSGFPDTWRLSKSFPFFNDTLFDDFTIYKPCFILDSQNTNTFSDDEREFLQINKLTTTLNGLSFSGQILLDCISDELNWIFFNKLDSLIKITGRIEIVNNIPVFYLKTENIAKISLFGNDTYLSLELLSAIKYDYLLNINTYQIFGRIITPLKFSLGSDNYVLNASAEISTSQMFGLDLCATFPDTGKKPELKEIGHLFGVDNFSLSTDFPFDDIQFQLQKIGVYFNTSIKSLDFYIELISEKEWKPIGEFLTFNNFKIKFFYSSALFTSVYANCIFLEKNICAEIRLPELDYYLYLKEDYKKEDNIDIGNLLSSLSIKIPGLEKITCSKFKLIGNIKQSSYRVYCELENVVNLDILDNNFKLTELVLFFGNKENKANFESRVQIDSINFKLYVHHENNDSWLIKGSSYPEQEISLGNNFFGLSLPDYFSQIIIKNISLSFKTGTSDINFKFKGKLPISDSLVAEIKIQIEARKVNNIPENIFSGTIKIGGIEFELKFSDDYKSSNFSATYKKYEPLELKLKDLISMFSPENAKHIPDELSIDLKNAFLFFSSEGIGRNFMIGITLGKDLDFSNLPVIGNKLADLYPISIKNLQIVYANNLIDLTTLDSKIRSELLNNREKIEKGIHLLTDLQHGQEVIPVLFDLGKQKSLENLPTVSNQDPVEELPKSGLNYPINKKIGPFDIKNIGIDFIDSKIWIYPAISFDLSNLKIGLDGLSVGIPLSISDIDYKIDGLSILYNEGSLSIGGSFLKANDSQFTGSALIKTPKINLSAIGSYDSTGKKSLFLFGVMNSPMLASPNFNIEAVAVGMGYNSKINLPSIDQVPKFSLIEVLKDGTTDLKSMMIDKNEISFSDDDLWIAAGLRFTSYEMVKSVALLTVKTAEQLEVDIIGTSTISVPNNVAEPIGFAEIAFMASFKPQEGVLSVLGKLTPASYVLSKDCKLRGGFAFSTWFSGEHEGDFVLTLGGYSSSFNIPSHYPRVPRLEIEWDISDNARIDGTAFFALTPSCIMAGGSMSFVWESGDLKAWFSTEIDFFLSWKPFYYKVEMSLSIGISYTLDLLFTSITVSVSISVDLSLYGPEFGGKAEVDLSVISFTISFGADEPKIQYISWEDFKVSFLPEKTLKQGNKEKKSCSVKIISGLIKSLSDEEIEEIEIKRNDKNEIISSDRTNWQVNPEQLVIQVNTVIPVKNIYFNQPQPKDKSIPLEFEKENNQYEFNTNFGIIPMGLSDIKSDLKINLSKYSDISDKFEVFPFTEEVVSELDIVIDPIIKNIPNALWINSVNINDDQLFRNALTGVVLKPLKPKSDKIIDIDIQKLLYEDKNDENENIYYSWVIPNPKIINFKEKISDDESNLDITVENEILTNKDYILSCLEVDSIKAKRNKLLDIMRKNNLQIDSDTILEKSSSSEFLMDWPLIRQTGRL